MKEIYNNDNNNSNNDNDKVSENIRNAWKSQAWLDTQQVSKRQIQLKHKRRQVNLSLEVSAERMTPRALNNKIAEPVERKKIKDME